MRLMIIKVKKVNETRAMLQKRLIKRFINLFWSIALVSLTFFTLIIMRRIFYKNLRNAENSLEEQYEEVGKYIHFIKKHNHDQGHHLIAMIGSMSLIEAESFITSLR